MNVTDCLIYLLPGAKFTVWNNDINRIVWSDERPQPTAAQIEAVWPSVQAQVAAATAIAQTATTNETTIAQQVDAALASNATFLAITSPTAAQNAAQVKALSRQMNGLIRLTRRKLDAVG